MCILGAIKGVVLERCLTSLVQGVLIEGFHRVLHFKYVYTLMYILHFQLVHAKFLVLYLNTVVSCVSCRVLYYVPQAQIAVGKCL